MTFAERLKISSIASLALLVGVAALLLWSSGELREASQNDVLADDIQSNIFRRATLRDEFFLHGLERSKERWLAVSTETRTLLQKGAGQFEGVEERRVLEQAKVDFDESVRYSQRLVDLVQMMSVADREMVHNDESASRIFGEIMSKDSSLEQASAMLQKLARSRFNRENDRMLDITLLSSLVIALGTMLNASFLNRLLARRLSVLKRGAAAVAGGDLSHRIEVRGDDEFADLGRAFNTVAEKVEEYTEQLEASYHLLSDLSSQVPGILFQAHLSPSGRFSTPYVSKGFSDLYETAPAEGVQAPATIFETSRSDEGIFASFVESARMQQPWEYEYKITVPNGSTKWLYGNARPVRLDDGGTMWHGFISDITERKQMEQVMAGARQQLEEEVQQRTAKLLLANEHLTQEIEIRKKVEVELLAQQQKLQELSVGLAMAEERERDRIASELHDQVGQRLILAKIKLDAMASKAPTSECESESMNIGSLVEQTIQDIRSLTFQIRPPLLASAGLEAALRWLAEELRADFGLEVETTDDGKEKPLPYEVRSTVFQAVRELLLNVAKHAGTNRCRVELARVQEVLSIQVDDDGLGVKGTVPGGTRGRSGGFGLVNVKQKIEHLGGRFTIEAKAAGGTIASIEVPLQTAG